MTRSLTAAFAVLLAVLLAGTPARTPAAAQRTDGLRIDTLAPGVTHARAVRPAGPWVVHVVRVDLRRPDLALRHVRAHDQLGSRERVSAMAARRTDAGDLVLAAVNADFFDLQSGASENNLVLDGEWWKGIRVTESPFDTYDNVHAQFALDVARRPHIGRFAFDGWVHTRQASFPILALNAPSAGAYEGTALFTPRFGPVTPRDTMRATSELALAPAGQRADTLLYVRRSHARGGGGAIPRDGVVLAAYGARAAALDSTADGDTLRLTLGVTPWPAPGGASAPLLVIGGWPRILRDGVNIAARASAEEGTISRNAEVRHPRTAVGFRATAPRCCSSRWTAGRPRASA